MGKIYAITDLHGQWELWQQIKEYCKPDDTIYFLGDAADRGPDGIKVMQDLIADERVFYLKGNHEDMLVTVIAEVLAGGDKGLPWWRMNGGQPTLDAFLKLTPEEMAELVQKLSTLPKYVKIENTKGQKIFLCHAGTALDYDSVDYTLIKGGDPYLWDRRHIVRPWPQAEEYKDWYIVHGHTPFVHLIDKLNETNRFYGKPLIPCDKVEIVEYCDGHKFCLDLGSFATDRVALFDLDELKVERYFEGPDFHDIVLGD